MAPIPVRGGTVTVLAHTDAILDPARSTTGASDGRRGMLALRVTANGLLGIAVGLLAYYGVTNIVNASDQRALAVEMGAAAARPAFMPAEGVRIVDLAGWGSEDAAYWRGLPEGGAFVRIVAETMDLDSIVVKGAEPADLRRGPGWIVQTDLPGGSGNVGISGHRTTYGQPFAGIDRLRPGDEIALYSPYRRYLYEVERVFVVRPEQVEVIAHTEDPVLTLTACHPPYSARYRMVARARLVDVRRLIPATLRRGHMDGGPTSKG